MRFRFGLHFGLHHRHNRTLKSIQDVQQKQTQKEIGSQLKAVIPLSNIPDGQTVKIYGILGRGRIARRLTEMGFTPGTTIEVIRRAPFSDPILLKIRGYYISLRSEEAAMIQVVKETIDKTELESKIQNEK